MECVRVGVIGVGNIGKMHAENIYRHKISGMQLSAVCDRKEERREYCSQNLPGIICYTDYKELLYSNQVDAVVISVPHRQHAEIAIEALRAGLHVLVEKPMDVTVTKAEELVKVAKQSEKIFAIMFNQRTNPLFQKAHDIVQSGLLGELKRSVWIVTNWYRTQHYYNSGTWRATWRGEGGGVLLNQAPHNLDLWQWICGMPQSVRAFCEVAKYHDIEVEDEVTIYAQYENGATGVFITSTGEYPGTNRLEISGDRGKLILEDAKLKWWKLSEPERRFCYLSQESFPNIDYEYEEFQMDEQETGHIGILQNFTNAILNGEELISPGEDGMNELALSNAAYLSEWNGNVEIVLPFDGKRFDALLEEHSAVSRCKREEADDCTTEQQKRWQVRW